MDRRPSRSPRGHRRCSSSPGHSPRRRSPRRSPIRSYGEYRRNRSPNRRRRDSPRRHRDDRSRRGRDSRHTTTHHDHLTLQPVRGRHSRLAGDIILRHGVTPHLLSNIENSGVPTPNAYNGKKGHNQKWPSPNVRPRKSLVTRNVSPSSGLRSRRKLWLNSMTRKLSVRHTMALTRSTFL